MLHWRRLGGSPGNNLEAPMLSSVITSFCPPPNIFKSCTAAASNEAFLLSGPPNGCVATYCGLTPRRRTSWRSCGVRPTDGVGYPSWQHWAECLWGLDTALDLCSRSRRPAGVWPVHDAPCCVYGRLLLSPAPSHHQELHQGVAYWGCEGSCGRFCHFQSGPLQQPTRGLKVTCSLRLTT